MKLIPCRIKSVSALFVLFWSLCTAILLGCQSSTSDQRPEGSVTVKIPLFDGQNYKLGLVELTTLEDLVNLRGAAANFLFSPSIQSGKLVGHSPKIRTMRTSDGTFVATDASSLQLLSLYAHLETLMKWDEMLGTKALNAWPRTVAVNTNINHPTLGVSRNNALYSGDLDAFLFVPYTQADLPLSVNGGVIAHEHFHSFFYRIVLQPLRGQFSEARLSNPHDTSHLEGNLRSPGERGSNLESARFTKRDLYHLSLFRAMNEGLADVWGYLYSNDLRFVSRSLVQERMGRDLNLASTQLIESKTDWEEKVHPHILQDTQKMYELGVKYARTLVRTLPENPDDEIKNKMAKAIIKSLETLRERYAKLTNKEHLEPGVLLEILSDEIPFLTTENCENLRAAVSSDSAVSVCKNRQAVQP